MEIASKGIDSDFIFHDFGAEVRDLGDCIRVRTPDNPDFFFGNFLLFPAPPAAGDVGRWQDRFAASFGAFPAVRHRCFQWNPVAPISADAQAAFETAGFTIDRTSVLSARSVHMDKPPAEALTIRPLRTDAEWQAVVAAQVADGFPGIPDADYLRYKQAMYVRYRAMSQAGLGDWWGAFRGAEMVANLGLYFGRGIGRFQSVGTLAAYRRQGICRTLVHHVSTQAFAGHPGIALVMHAEAGEAAERIYKSLGYEQIEIIESAFRAP